MTQQEAQQEPFNWSTVGAFDPDDLAAWIGATDAKERQFPLQVALQVHDEYETRLMQPGKMDALQLSEVRGALLACSRFAKLYAAAVESASRDAARGAGEAARA